MAISVTGLTVHTQNGGGTWQNYGSGGGSSSTTATFLSGTSAQGRKFTGVKGFAYQVNAAGTDLSNSILVVRWLVNGGLASTKAAGGARIRIEDTSGNTSDFYIDGSDTYTGGWRESVIDTSNSESANSGTAATLTAIQYVGLVVDAAASSGGDPNVYVDEVLSLPNTGLTLGGNTTNVWDEFFAWDDTSLYGIVQQRAGITFVKCPVILSPDASNHSSTDEIVVFEEPSYYDGTNTDACNSNAGMTSTDADTINFTRLTAICENNGDINGVNSDKVLDFTSAGDVNADTCVFRGFDGATVHLGGTGNSYDDCTFQLCSQISDSGAVVRRGFVRDTAAAATEAALLWTTSSDWQDTNFIMGSTNSHALEIESNITDSWSGFVFTGYNTSAGPTSVGNEVLINNATGGVVTINASGIAETISFRNNGTSTTTVNSTSQVTLSGLVNNTEVTVYDAGDGSEIATVEDVTGNQFQFSDTPGNVVNIFIHKEDYYRADLRNYTIPSNNTTIPISQRFDPNYVNN